MVDLCAFLIARSVTREERLQSYVAQNYLFWFQKCSKMINALLCNGVLLFDCFCSVLYMLLNILVVNLLN
ncbi:unnamed protein product, partial [Arabidopsis halleri]